MNILLEPSLVIVTSLVEVVIPGDPLMLFLLLLDIILGLLHGHEHFLEFLILLILLSLLFLALNVVAHDVLRGRDLLDLEVDHSSAHLDGLRDGWRERQTASNQDQGTELRHVVLEVEAIVFKTDDGVAAADTYIVNAQI